MPEVSIIIPAYNEEKIIGHTLRSITNYFRQNQLTYEAIVSDDGSMDKTREAVEKISADYQEIKLVKNVHQGKAHAIRSGLQVALGDVILFMDADGATDISELDKLLPLLRQGADIVIGSREGLRAKRLNEPYYRHLMGRVFNKVVRFLVGLNFDDTQCGFKLFHKPVINELAAQSKIMSQPMNNLKRPLVTAFDVELLVLAKLHGFKIVEVPVVWQYVPTNRINPLNDSLSMFLEVLRVRINLLTGRYRTPVKKINPQSPDY